MNTKRLSDARTLIYSYFFLDADGEKRASLWKIVESKPELEFVKSFTPVDQEVLQEFAQRCYGQWNNEYLE